MCDFGISESIGAGIAIASIVTSVISAAISTTLGIVSAQQQANAQQAQYEYQAEVQKQNAKIAQDNAGMQRQAGIEEARRQRVKTLQAIGSQKAALAANGLDVGFGTSLDIIEDTAMMGELDALMIETEAERKAQNYEIQANNFTNEANLNSYAARNARTAGTMNAIGAGVKGVGQIASIGFNSAVGFGSVGSSGLNFGKDASGFTIGSNKLGNVFAGLGTGLS